jgi:Tfp pilus assembly protein PilP
MRQLLTFVLAVSAAAPLVAQTPTAEKAPAAEKTPAAERPAAPAEKTPAESYTYHADGRRDPFLTLINTGPEPRPVARKGDGLGALTLAEITVRGVMQSRDSLVAMVAGPDNKTYIVHEGDRLLDGQVKGINREGLVVVQRVSDPLAQVKQREVRKLLQSLEAAKE